MGDHWLLLRLVKGGPATGKWDGTVFSEKTPRLLVYRFDFKRGPEEAWMWVDPAPACARPGEDQPTGGEDQRLSIQRHQRRFGNVRNDHERCDGPVDSACPPWREKILSTPCLYCRLEFGD